MAKIDSDNDGQHRSGSYYNPGEGSGMKSSISSAARVGQIHGGGQQMSVPKPHRDCMVDTTEGSAGPRAAGEVTGGDDR